MIIRMYPQQPVRSHRWLRRFAYVLLVILLIGGVGVYNYVRPLPAATLAPGALSTDINDAKVTWAPNMQAAVGAAGFGLLATHSSQSPMPIASVAKVITALTVLQKKPLAPGQTGPLIPLTADDVARYDSYASQGGAVARVVAGEQLNEYQALQIMLVGSANNVADSLAVWAFGSMDAYVRAANAYVKQHHLPHTIVAADASGFSPDTRSTAEDLVALGILAMQQPVVADIVAQPKVAVPLAGTIANVNPLLGQDGVVGIKTGSTENGGSALLAGRITLAGQAVTIVAATVGSANIRQAIVDARTALDSAEQQFSVHTDVVAGQQFGTYQTAWGQASSVVAQTNVTIVAWNGTPLMPHVTILPGQRANPKGAVVGSVIVQSAGNHGASPLILQKAVAGPSFRWRLLRH